MEADVGLEAWCRRPKADCLPITPTAFGFCQRATCDVVAEVASCSCRRALRRYQQPDLYHEEVVELETPFEQIVRCSPRHVRLALQSQAQHRACLVAGCLRSPCSCWVRDYCCCTSGPHRGRCQGIRMLAKPRSCTRSSTTKTSTSPRSLPICPSCPPRFSIPGTFCGFASRAPADLPVQLPAQRVRRRLSHG